MPKIREKKLTVSFYTKCTCGKSMGFYSNPLESQLNSLLDVFASAAEKCEKNPCLLCQLVRKLKKHRPKESQKNLRAWAETLKTKLDAGQAINIKEFLEDK